MFALVVILLGSPAWAEASISTTTRYYEVGGTTPTDIRTELNRRRPRGWDGYTEWHVSWNFRYAPGTGSCRMTAVATRVTVTYTLPRWTAPAGASRETRAAWEHYLKALVLHENGHGDIGIGVAKEVDATLRSMTAPSCPDLELRANETGHRLLDRARARERDYDRTTNHGATQGARFP